MSDDDSPFTDLPQVETERLLLRKLREEDIEDFFHYAADPEVSRYTVWEPHTSIADSRRFVEMVLEQYRNGEIAPWGVVPKSLGKVIGTCGFATWFRWHRRAEIGYAIAEPYWGRGYMTEAIRAVIDFGFTRLNLYRIEARCLPENIGSARVMEKCGMQYEGTLRAHMFVKGEFQDLKMYSILRDEWKGRA